MRHTLLILRKCYKMVLKNCLYIWSCFGRYIKLQEQPLWCVCVLRNTCLENLGKVFFYDFYNIFLNSFLRKYLWRTASKENLKNYKEHDMIIEMIWYDMVIENWYDHQEIGARLMVSNLCSEYNGFPVRFHSLAICRGKLSSVKEIIQSGL